MFDITEQAIDAAQLRQSLLDNEQCGAFTSFEGWVRRQNDGQRVDYLVYSTYEELARKQGEAVIAAAKQHLRLKTPSAYTATASWKWAIWRFGWALPPATATPPSPPAALSSIP